MRHCRGQFCHLVPARILSVRIPGTFFAMYKNHLLKGALLLTAAGVFSRIIGFFYRIFLSRTFGAEQMGIYELISPVLALSFALCTSSRVRSPNLPLQNRKQQSTPSAGYCLPVCPSRSSFRASARSLSGGRLILFPTFY